MVTKKMLIQKINDLLRDMDSFELRAYYSVMLNMNNKKGVRSNGRKAAADHCDHPAGE